MVIGYDDKGLPKTKNVLAKTKAECEKKLKNLIAAQKESDPQPPQQTTPPGSPTAVASPVMSTPTARRNVSRSWQS